MQKPGSVPFLTGSGTIPCVPVGGAFPEDIVQVLKNIFWTKQYT